MKKYIFFDIDDTLLGTFENSYKIFNSISKKYGFKISREDFLVQYKKGDFNKNIDFFFKKYVNFEEANQLYEERKKKYPKKIFLTKKIREFLTEKGYELGILTNGPAQKTYQKLAYLGFEEKDLCLILHEENLGEKKPDPQVFNKVFELIGDKYESLIYIGDSLDDYSAAKGANVLFYAVLTGMSSKVDFINAGLDSDCILSGLSTLINVLH